MIRSCADVQKHSNRAFHVAVFERGRTHEFKVHLTPDGQADALVPSPTATSTTTRSTTTSLSSLCFASAHTQLMPFPEALRLISSGSSDPFVAYAQEQNDCFRSEYSSLSSDVETHIPWATEALGCHPEAVNLWIGNHLSTTSFHKDHYENLYAVITGEKHFLLLPPTDVHRLYIQNYPAARYSLSQETGELTLQLEEPRRHVPWCSVNPYPPAAIKDQEVSKFPLYFNGPRPFECTKLFGGFYEIVVIKAQVSSSPVQARSPDNRGRTIAINYCMDSTSPTIRSPLFSNTLAVREKNFDDSAIINE
ncbi:hypothetical protein C5167_039636 [Papaver somniferum]|uniref:JmjC domain-containing protein n=1 Tax=Papaver somniferum TaxID=3469 RepID=A0A4Y7ICN5_PAPSO|nr:hypothetical protein C5167_039636 [Papaver somniferum]